MAGLLGPATSPETVGADLVIVPLGSLEQHGPHLPLDTDTQIATAVATRVSALIPGSWVAPAVAFGSSGEHQSFAGTTSIGSEALRLIVIELTRSIAHWARRVVFINGHGGNLPAVRGAVDQLRVEGHDVRAIPCWLIGADAHAGRTETSLMLYLSPETVHLRLAEAGNTAPLDELMPLLMTAGVTAASPNGILGDPRDASAAEGRQLLRTMVANVCEALTHELV